MGLAPTSTTFTSGNAGNNSDIEANLVLHHISVRDSHEESAGSGLSLQQDAVSHTPLWVPRTAQPEASRGRTALPTAQRDPLHEPNDGMAAKRRRGGAGAQAAGRFEADARRTRLLSGPLSHPDQ